MMSSEEGQAGAASSSSNDVTIAKVLSEEQINSLSCLIRDMLASEVEEEEDVSDIIEYAIAMIQNGKSVDYCTDELNGMGLLTSEAIIKIGNMLNEFLSADEENKKNTANKIAIIKATRKANALTMSGALSSARPGDKQHQKIKGGNRGGKRAPVTNTNNVGRTALPQPPPTNIKQTAKNNNNNNDNNNNRKRSLVSEAFGRLANKHSKNDHNGRPQQRPPRPNGRPQQQPPQQQQWRFDVSDEKQQEANNSTHQNRQQKFSPSPRYANNNGGGGGGPDYHTKNRNIPVQQVQVLLPSQQQQQQQQDRRQTTTTANSNRKQWPQQQSPRNNNVAAHASKPALVRKEPERSGQAVAVRKEPERKAEEQEFIPAAEYNESPYSNNYYEGPSYYDYRSGGRRGGAAAGYINTMMTPNTAAPRTSLTYVRNAAAIVATTTSVLHSGDAAGSINKEANDSATTSNPQQQYAPSALQASRGGGRFFAGYHHPAAAATPPVYEDVFKKIEQKKWVRQKAVVAEEQSPSNA